MKRIISAVLLSGAVSFMGVSGAQAVTYPAPAPAVSVSDGTLAPGEAFTFSGAGFTPGESIQITISNENVTAGGGGGGGGSRGTSVSLAIQPAAVTTSTVVADSTGKFSIPVTLDEAGVYTLTAKGLTSGKTESASVTVVAPTIAVAGATTSGEDTLPATGATGMVVWSAVGLGALALGTGSVIAVRRKASESGSIA